MGACHSVTPDAEFNLEDFEKKCRLEATPIPTIGLYHWIKTYADKGNKEACYFFGMINSGLFYPYDYNISKKYLKKSIKLGYNRTKIQLAAIYYKGYENRMRNYIIDNNLFQYDISQYHENQNKYNGFNRGYYNYDKAFKLLRQIEDTKENLILPDRKQLCFFLANMYIYGHGTEININIGNKYLKEGIALDCPYAINLASDLFKAKIIIYEGDIFDWHVSILHRTFRGHYDLAHIYKDRQEYELAIDHFKIAKRDKRLQLYDYKMINICSQCIIECTELQTIKLANKRLEDLKTAYNAPGDLEIILKTGTKTIDSAIIIAKSPFIKRILDSTMMESKTYSINLDLFSTTTLYSIFEYIYCEQIIVFNANNACEIYAAADYLEIDEIKNKVMHYLLDEAILQSMDIEVYTAYKTQLLNDFFKYGCIFDNLKNIYIEQIVDKYVSHINNYLDTTHSDLRNIEFKKCIDSHVKDNSSGSWCCMHQSTHAGYINDYSYYLTGNASLYIYACICTELKSKIHNIDINKVYFFEGKNVENFRTTWCCLHGKTQIAIRKTEEMNLAHENILYMTDLLANLEPHLVKIIKNELKPKLTKYGIDRYYILD